MNHRIKSRVKSLLKYAFAFTLLIIIFRNAGAETIIARLKQMSPSFLVRALALVTLAQSISALRMRFFFRASGFSMNRWFAFTLYYVGAFYNFLVPGGVGGDAYKVLLAKRRMMMPALLGIRIMLADRASGLCIVILMMLFALYDDDFLRLTPYAHAVIIAAAFITVVSYLFFSQLLLKQSPRVMLLSLPYSLIAQLLWVGALVTILMSIGGGGPNTIQYIALYSASCITGMLPISPGGLGIKEMTYKYGAELINKFAGLTVDGNLGVAVSLCLFAITFLAALPGFLWLEKVEKAHHS